jgi:hypothetical protein
MLQPLFRPCVEIVATRFYRIAPKSGRRFSAKAMRKQKAKVR